MSLKNVQRVQTQQPNAAKNLYKVVAYDVRANRFFLWYKFRSLSSHRHTRAHTYTHFSACIKINVYTQKRGPYYTV